MTPNELYALQPIETSNEVLCLYRYMAEVDFYRIGVDRLPEIELRYYASECFDGERGWELFSAWFNGIPFMICQGAGRGNSDHANEFVTNRKAYRDAVQLLVSKYRDSVGVEFDPSREIEGIDCFYNYHLSEFYDKNLSPSYRPGDVVLVLVSENHLRFGSPMIQTRCRIDKVSQYKPTGTYSGTQIDRRWGGNEIITDEGNGSLGCRFSESEVIGVVHRESMENSSE